MQAADRMPRLESRQPLEKSSNQIRADLNQRHFARETAVYPPGLSTSWWLQVRKNRWNPAGDRHYLYQHCTCKCSLSTETKLSFRIFWWAESQFSDERASLPGIRLLLSMTSKIPPWLFSSPYWPHKIFKTAVYCGCGLGWDTTNLDWLGATATGSTLALASHSFQNNSVIKKMTVRQKCWQTDKNTLVVWWKWEN